MLIPECGEESANRHDISMKSGKRGYRDPPESLAADASEQGSGKGANVVHRVGLILYGIGIET